MTSIAMAAALAAGGLAAASTPASGAAPRTDARAFEVQRGVTAPIHDYRDAIRESVWVQAPDLDGDGAPEQVVADIVRPRELDGVERVPVVMDASPYYLCCGRGNESEKKEYDGGGDPTRFPLFYDNYFVPRGYGYVAVDMAGTARSTGCTDMGASSDILSVKAVVDWLNGNATAVDSAGNPVEADWSNGRTAMIGKSYDGTLANGVAATGVEGLETIVPIGAISSWYDYTRYQGLPFSYNYPTFLSSYVARNRTEPVDCSESLATMAAQDGDETGAYTDFWAARDYRRGPTMDASKVRASVFIVHGLQDNNVKATNASRWWEELGRHGVDRKMWLSRVGHVDPFDSDRESWVRTLHRWFDHELLDIDNGIDHEPAVRVETAPSRWEAQRDWPVEQRGMVLTPRADGRLVLGRGSSAGATWVNDPTQTEAKALTAGDNPHRLLFTTGALTRPLRLTGAPRIELEVSHSAPTGQIGVALVDYGDAERVLSQGDGVVTGTTESCWGASAETDDACYLDVRHRLGSTPLQVLSRGWARLDGAGRHRVTVDMIPNDTIVPAGHQLGLVVVGAYRGWVVTVDPAPTTYRLELGGTLLRLPLEGPAADFGRGARRIPTMAELDPGTLPNPRSATRIPE
jgi:X-Pro dipeptidyl-peptidase